MKVYFFTNEYPPNVYGGAGVHVDYLSKELAKLTSLNVKCFGSQNYKKDNLCVNGVDIDKTLLEGISKDRSFVFSAFYKCMKFFNPPFDADIVHCHTWYSHFAGILAKLAYGIPLVVTTHSLEPLRPWKREQIGQGFEASSWIERQALELADAIIAVSKDTKNDILKNFPVNEKKIHIIPNGIDPFEFQPKKNISVLHTYGIDYTKPYVLFVGRITRQKGIIHLVDAISYINPNTQVVLCAGAPDTLEIKEEMDKRINEIRKTRKNIIWIDTMLENSLKIELYSNASVFCCPSIYEPFGIINLEAMSCGTPVVGTKIGGIPEVVVHGETGLLVPLTFDPLKDNDQDKKIAFSKSLAENINNLINSPTLCQEMGKKSRQRVIDNFSWNSIANKIFELYKTLTLK